MRQSLIFFFAIFFAALPSFAQAPPTIEKICVPAMKEIYSRITQQCKWTALSSGSCSMSCGHNDSYISKDMPFRLEDVGSCSVDYCNGHNSECIKQQQESDVEACKASAAEQDKHHYDPSDPPPPPNPNHLPVK